jgi:hypothetical protein
MKDIKNIFKKNYQLKSLKCSVCIQMHKSVTLLFNAKPYLIQYYQLPQDQVGEEEIKMK